MTKTIVFFIFVIFILSFKESESQDVYDLWKGEAKPYYKENDLKEYEEEAWGTMCLFDVTEPILTVYKAQGKNTGRAVIVIPGGGYSIVAIHHEGYDVAEVLAKLYFRKMTNKEIAENTLLNLVSNETPPAFLVHAYDDDVCKVKESTWYAKKLLDNKVLVEMHLFSKGGHGFGLGRKDDGTDQWAKLFINWLKLNI